MPFLGDGGSKLWTYRMFKQTYGVEKCCVLILPPCHRSAFCKFRCGVAPIRIKTGRYKTMAEEGRKCPFCKTVIENETHVILECPIIRILDPIYSLKLLVYTMILWILVNLISWRFYSPISCSLIRLCARPVLIF